MHDQHADPLETDAVPKTGIARLHCFQLISHSTEMLLRAAQEPGTRNGLDGF